MRIERHRAWGQQAYEMSEYHLGLILGNNLILSFDRRGTIDMTMIDFIIRNEIIPRL